MRGVNVIGKKDMRVSKNEYQWVSPHIWRINQAITIDIFLDGFIVRWSCCRSFFTFYCDRNAPKIFICVHVNAFQSRIGSNVWRKIVSSSVHLFSLRLVNVGSIFFRIVRSTHFVPVRIAASLTLLTESSGAKKRKRNRRGLS